MKSLSFDLFQNVGDNFVPLEKFCAFYFNQNAQYIFYLNNIYIIITPTCFDTFLSTAGTSEVVLRRSHVVSISLKFNKKLSN